MTVALDRRSALALAAIIALYAALALPTIGRQGIHWDEQTDLEIAESYFVSRGTPLSGSPADAVNTRLPMFSVAAIQLVGLPLNLRTARLVSCLVGALTLLGIFSFAWIALDERRGLIAALLVAVNPYFLAYAPLAFTEGDVFIGCAVSWMLAAFAWLWQRPSRGRVLVAGLVLGLAVSSKISGLALFPAVLIAGWIAVDRPATPSDVREALRWIGIGCAFALWLLLEAVATNTILPGARLWIPELLRAPISRLLIVTALLSGFAGWALVRRRAPVSLAGLLLGPLVIAATTFFVVPPSHTTNGAIFSKLWVQLLGAGGEFDFAVALEAGLLHLTALWLKPSIGIGTALFAGVAFALVRWRSRPELRWPLLVVACYGGFLLTLPWAQIRYGMAVLPALAILASDALAGLFARRRRLGIALAAAMTLLLAVDLSLCYPDLNLNGYQWLGTRYFAGRSTIGYRSIGQVGNDGLAECTRWVADHASEGETVVTYTIARHIVERARPDVSSARWVDGVNRREALHEADWVITHLNDDIRDGYGEDDPSGDVFQYPMYDRAALLAGFERAHTVTRSFDIEVAAVWRRR